MRLPWVPSILSLIEKRSLGRGWAIVKDTGGVLIELDQDDSDPARCFSKLFVPLKKTQLIQKGNSEPDDPALLLTTVFCFGSEFTTGTLNLKKRQQNTGTSQKWRKGRSVFNTVFRHKILDLYLKFWATPEFVESASPEFGVKKFIFLRLALGSLHWPTTRVRVLSTEAWNSPTTALFWNKPKFWFVFLKSERR